MSLRITWLMFLRLVLNRVTDSLPLQRPLLGISGALFFSLSMGIAGCNNGGGGNGGNNGNGGGNNGGGGTSTQPTITTIKVGASPAALAVNTTTNIVYVTGSPNGPNVPGTVTVINGATNAVIKTITVGDGPIAIAIDEVGNQIYVGNANDGTYSVINGACECTTLTPNPPLGGPVQSNGMVWDAAEGVFLAINAQNGVSVIRPLNATKLVATGAHPGGIGVNTSTGTAFVANALGNDPNGSPGGTLSAVNPATYTDSTVTTFPACNPAGAFPGVFRANGVAVNSTTNMIYMGCGETIAAVNATSYTFTLVPSVGAPLPIAVNETTNMVYAANEDGNTVTVINGATNAATTVPTGMMPVSIAVNEQTNKIYTANANGTSVTEIDGATNKTSTIQVGNGPGSIIVNPVTNIVYVVNGNDGTVSAIQE